MGRKILVTGCGGFVGGTIVRQAPKDVELHAVTRRKPPVQRNSLVWHVLDLRDASEVRRMFTAVAPDAVIHAAAIADIDFCEAHRNTAWQVNAGVTQRLAHLCREYGARLVFVSTDNVFDGEKGPYSEEDEPAAINYYAETKLAAERAVMSLGVNYVVARTALVLGFPPWGSGNSFLSRMTPVLREGKRLGVPENEIRSPIDVVTLARALLELAMADCEGLIHLAGNDVLNRCEMVRRIAWGLGFSPDLVYPNNPETIPGRAPRPRDVSLSNKKARKCLRTPMKDLLDGLRLVTESGPPSSP